MNKITPKILTYILFITISILLIGKFIQYFSSGFSQSKAKYFSLCGIEDLENKLKELERLKKHALVIIGDGVFADSTKCRKRPYATNNAQGFDMWEGADFAMKKNFFLKIKENIDVIYIDDGGDLECAEKISRILITCPYILTIIGHATSSTTAIAIENYKKANIPILIPIATNPDLVDKCSSCFRLPSNDDIQALVLSDFAKNSLKGRKIYLIWDASQEAIGYSEFLKNKIIASLGPYLNFRQPIVFRPLNYRDLFQSIPYNNTDVLVFCGYGSIAREFLNGLRFEYKGKEEELPRLKVLLSDGCKIQDIKDVAKFGFDVYVAFPSEEYTYLPCFDNFKPNQAPNPFIGLDTAKSYETFGYDAIALFSAAYKKSWDKEKKISRSTINFNLKNLELDPFYIEDSLMCYQYKFKNGENEYNKYFIYSVLRDSIEKSYSPNEISKLIKDANQ